MALAALITATHEAREPGVSLRATFWLGGRTVIERQARLAADAGAREIVVLVEQLPAELVEALERLRKDGLEIITARKASEAAEAVPSGTRLLMIADGFVGDRSHAEALVAAGRPGLLAVGDRGYDERFERIDNEWRWAGLALLDGDLLRDVALMPGEWDVQSTLLRRAIQTGVKPVPAAAGDDAVGLTIVERRQDFAELQRRIVGHASQASGNWLSRLVLLPLERLGSRLLMTTPITPLMVAVAAILLVAGAAGAFLTGWRWLGLVPLILSVPLEGIAIRLARLRLMEAPRFAWWRLAMPALAALCLVALSRTLAAEAGWGVLLLGVMVIAFLVALHHEMEGKNVLGAVFLADRHSATLLLLPFAVAGMWAAGIAFLFGYSALSFFWAQFQVHRPQD